MHIAIIGAGYVGLCTGVSLATHGHVVTFVERRDDRREALAAGVMPIVEPGLEAAYVHASERIELASRLDASRIDLVLVAVGTPVGDGGRSDVSQLESACASLSEWTDVHVSFRSTLPPGLSARLPAMLGREDGERISTNPEFLRQGAALHDVDNPSRIVIGRYSETSKEHLERVRALYAHVPGPRLEVSVAAAELIKNVANAFLALKLSFVNEIASLSEEYDVDIDEVLAGISLDPRIGSVYMRPGLGFGGSCLPKELEVVASSGRRMGLPMHIARAAATVNADQQARFARRILRELGSGSRRVALLGLSFKAGTDDLRGSPSMTLAQHLVDAGVEVVGHDPVVAPAAAVQHVTGMRVVPDLETAVEQADAIVIGTDWPEYATIDWRSLGELVRRRVVFDGRNLLEPAAVTAAGFAYRGVGRRSIDAEVQRLEVLSA